MGKKGIGPAAAVIIVLGIIFLIELVIFSQHYYHGMQELRVLGESTLLLESSKLETWVRSFQKASELSLRESTLHSGSGLILLPYELERNYSPSYLPYWQIYDEPIEICNKIPGGFACPEEIFKNYFNQKISLISLNYLKNYKKDFESLSNSFYEIDFHGSIKPRININEGNVLLQNYIPISFTRNFSDEKGNDVKITRQIFLTTYLYSNFEKIIKKAIYILENDYIGKCLANDSSLPVCYHKKYDKDDAKNALKRLEKNFEEKDVKVSFDLDFFGVLGQNFFGVVNVSIFDNTSSFVTYDLLNNSMKLDFIGLRFAVKTGDLITDFYQTNVKNLNSFKQCSSLSMFSKEDICNYFSYGSEEIYDEDSMADPFIFGKCIDYTGEYPDYCFGNILYEYKDSGNNLCYFEKFVCTECKEGRCKPSSCYDSDNLNAFIKGYVQYDSKQIYDFCVDEKTVGEYYCNDGYVDVKNLECEENCSCNEGACQLPDSCKLLNMTIINSMFSSCDDEKYNPVADLNKNKFVNIEDLVNFSTYACNSTFCQEKLSDTFNPCVKTLTSCSVLDQEGATYLLDTDIINSENSTCMNIIANRITLDCQGHLIDGIDNLNTYGIRISRYPPTDTDITIKNCVVTNWRYGIYTVASMNISIINSTFSSNYAGANILYGSHYNKIFNSTFSNNDYGVYFSESSSNSIYNCKIENNSLVGIYFTDSGGNNIINTSISSSQIDYYLMRSQLLSSENYFINTNFTEPRKIYFFKDSLWFSYRNDSLSNIWLKTSVSEATNITRRLLSWGQTNITWNESSTIPVIAYYNITGLLPNTLYNVQNNSGIYEIQTGIAGNLSFQTTLIVPQLISVYKF
ncbi:MAG: NosD domain-containing protein [Candidatus Aenigmatarchaeota archaeon]